MISVIIPAYKNTDELIINLKKNLTFLKDCEVIIVNDNPDESITSYLMSYPNIKLYENKQNLGFGGSCNVGVKQATQKYVMLLNSDVILHNTSYLKALEHFDKDSQLFAVGFAQREKNGQVVGRNKLYFTQGFIHHQKAQKTTIGQTAWAEGGACLIRKDMFIQINGFDPLYSPFYWEDVDLSYNAWKRGFKNFFDPEVEVEHHHESTIGKYFNRDTIKSISYRNQLIFMWKNLDAHLLIIHILYIIPTVLKMALTRETAFFTGLIKALALLPKVIKSRLKTNKHWVKSDGEIFQLFTNI